MKGVQSFWESRGFVVESAGRCKVLHMATSIQSWAAEWKLCTLYIQSEWIWAHWKLFLNSFLKRSNRWRLFSTRGWSWTFHRRDFSRGRLGRRQQRAWAPRRRLTLGWLAQNCAPWCSGPSGPLFLWGPEKSFEVIAGFWFTVILRDFTCWCFAFAMSSLIFFSFTWCEELIVYLALLQQTLDLLQSAVFSKTNFLLLLLYPAIERYKMFASTGCLFLFWKIFKMFAHLASHLKSGKPDLDDCTLCC